MSKIALLPGGFKPPHAGHYNMAKWLSANTGADTTIIFVGPKEREGITQEMSLKLWELYTQNDSGLEVRPAGVSPVRDVYDFIEQEAPEGSTVFLGMGEKDTNDKRYANIGKFAEPRGITFETTLVPPQAGGVSGTEMRGFIKMNDKALFQYSLPEHLSDEQLEQAWSIVTGLEEDLYDPNDPDLDFMKSNIPGPKKDIPRTKDQIHNRQTNPHAHMSEDSQSETGKILHAYDFDDTIARVKANIRVYITSPNGEYSKELLIPAEKFPEESKALEARLGNLDIEYDFSEFEKQIGDAIVNTGVVNKLKNSLSRPDVKTTILTARSIGHPVTRYMREELGLAAYVVPLGLQVGGKVTGKDKANWIEKHIKKGYNTIYFIDDSEENRTAVEALKDTYPNINLTVENPHEVSEMMGMMTKQEKAKHAKNMKRLSKDMAKINKGNKGNNYGGGGYKVPNYVKGTLTRKLYELSKQEKAIVDDIVFNDNSLEEININQISDKLKKYGKKGLLTLAIVLSVARQAPAQNTQDVIDQGMEYVSQDEKTDLYNAIMSVAMESIKEEDYNSEKELQTLRDIVGYYSYLRDGTKAPFNLSPEAQKLVDIYKENLAKDSSSLQYHINNGKNMNLEEKVSFSDLDSIETYADNKLDPIDVEFTDHFFNRLNDPRNKKEISNAELIGFFKRLSKRKKELIDFLEKYKEIVASDSRTNINIPFVKQVDKIIAKTILRKKGFQTSNPKLAVSEIFPGFLTDLRKEPGDIWKLPISGKWAAIGPQGFRMSYRSKRHAEIWAKTGKDHLGNDEEELKKLEENKKEIKLFSKDWWKKQLTEVITETKANTHLTHLEELILTQGQDGFNQAKNFLYELIKNLKGESNTIKNVSVKWDGAPAIFTGINPDNGQFFVGTKSVFNKNPKINYTPKDIDENHGHAPGLAKKLKLALQYLPALGIKGILQGDFMFDNDEVETNDIEGIPHYTFKPNTIRYAVESNSELGKKIIAARIGIIFHTTYNDLSGGGASFGANISGLSESTNVWFDDAYFKDNTGILLSDQEEKFILEKINEADSIDVDYTNLPLKNLNIYINSEIKQGEFLNDPSKSFERFKNWYQQAIDKGIAKVKRPETKEKKRQAGEEKLKEFESQKQDILNVFRISRLLSEAKSIFITKYDKAVATKHFIDKGDGTLGVTKAEGFVAVDHTENGIKLVDRLEFSRNNFNAGKPGAKK